MLDMIYDFIAHIFLLKVDEPRKYKPATKTEKVLLLMFMALLVVSAVIIINQ